MRLLERVRFLCLAMPEAFERETWDHATFRVGRGRGKIFCTAAPDGSQITLKADPLEREALLAQGGPYFVPAYVGDEGWLGIRLDDAGIDWEEAAHRDELLPGRTETPQPEHHKAPCAQRMTGRGGLVVASSAAHRRC
jgi:hypothetical protein